MKDKACNLHKRLAMGDTVKGYAQGGTIGTGVSAGSPRATVPGNPLTSARRNNGVKGMKKGGSTSC